MPEEMKMSPDYLRGFNDGVHQARRVVNDISTEFQRQYPLADEDLIRDMLAQIDALHR